MQTIGGAGGAEALLQFVDAIAAIAADPQAVKDRITELATAEDAALLAQHDAQADQAKAASMLADANAAVGDIQNRLAAVAKRENALTICEFDMGARSSAMQAAEQVLAQQQKEFQAKQDAASASLLQRQQQSELAVANATAALDERAKKLAAGEAALAAAQADLQAAKLAHAAVVASLNSALAGAKGLAGGSS